MKCKQIAALTVAGTLTFGMPLATVFAHEHEEIEAETPVTTTTVVLTHDITEMQQIVATLTRVVDLLQQKAAIMGIAAAQHDADEAPESDVLQVWVEVHGYATHAHVLKPHQPLKAFFVAPMYTDKSAVIAAIATEAGLTAKEVEAVIDFPTQGLDDRGDSIEEEKAPAEAKDVTKIHIMGDGMIMWGDGTKVEGATITTDNKVKLTDGTVVIPAADLR